jgi:hypothetical protein
VEVLAGLEALYSPSTQLIGVSGMAELTLNALAGRKIDAS